MKSPERDSKLSEIIKSLEKEGYRVIRTKRKLDAIAVKGDRVVGVTVFTKVKSHRWTNNHGKFVTRLSGGIVLHKIKKIFGEFDDIVYGVIFHDRT